MFDVSSFSRKILQYRKDRSLTQEALARELGITAQAISKWENGESMPDISILPDLSRALGVSLDTLLDVPYIENLDRFEKQAKITYASIKKKDKTDRKTETVWGMFKAVFQSCFHNLIKADEQRYCINDDFRQEISTRWDDEGLCFVMKNEFLKKISTMDTNDISSLLGTLNKNTLDVLKHLSFSPTLPEDLMNKTGETMDSIKETLLSLMEKGLVGVYNGGYILAQHAPVVMLLASLTSLTRFATHINNASGI